MGIELRIPRSHAAAVEAAPSRVVVEDSVVRFDPHQRLQHILMMSSFIILALTGLPQKFSDLSLSRWWVDSLGGLETVRVIHRTAGIVMLTDCVYHLCYLAYRVGIQRQLGPLRMIPTPKDARDVVLTLLYFLGLQPEKPKFDRFSYLEKFDYWAVFWGIVMIGGSGLILIFPVLAVRFLPGQILPVAITIHSDEAILAVGWILVVHMFNVHLAPWVFPFNPAIFTGKMTAHRCAEEHPLEWERITSAERALLRLAPAATVDVKRPAVAVREQAEASLPRAGNPASRWAASAMRNARVLHRSVWRLVTRRAESGAVTVWASAVVLIAASFLVAAPRIWHQSGGAQALSARQAATLTPQPRDHATLVPELGPVEPKALVHRQVVLDRFSCGDCHGVASGWLMPGDHAALPESGCQSCHVKAPEPPAITLHNNTDHEVVSADCGLCHKAFATSPRPASTAQTLCVNCHGTETYKVLPVSHAERSDATTTCIVCHQTRLASQPQVPHRIDGLEQCTFCHGPQRLTSLSGAHNSQAAEKCLGCHDVVRPPSIYSKMHTLSTEKGGCTSCHAAGKLAPLPGSHDGRSELLCGICHQPASKEPAPVPHSVAQDAACTSCHTDGQLGKLPYDHATRSEPMCVACHAERPGGVPAIPHALDNRAACTSCHLPSSSPAVPHL